MIFGGGTGLSDNEIEHSEAYREFREKVEQLRKELQPLDAKENKLYQKIKQMDRTDRIINELEQMLNEGTFSMDLADQIKELIANLRANRVNLQDYKNHNARATYGDAIIDAIIMADQRQQNRD